MTEESMEKRLRTYMTHASVKDTVAEKIFKIRAQEMDSYLRRNQLPPVRFIELAQDSESEKKRYWITNQDSVDVLAELLHKSSELSRTGQQGFIVRYETDDTFGFAVKVTDQGMKFLQDYLKNKSREEVKPLVKSFGPSIDAVVLPYWGKDHRRINGAGGTFGGLIHTTEQMQPTILEQNYEEGAANTGRPVDDEKILGPRSAIMDTHSFVVSPVRRDLTQEHRPVSKTYLNKD